MQPERTQDRGHLHEVGARAYHAQHRTRVALAIAHVGPTDAATGRNARARPGERRDGEVECAGRVK